MTKSRIGIIVILAILVQVLAPSFYQLVLASPETSFEKFITSVEIKKNGEDGLVLYREENTGHQIQVLELNLPEPESQPKMEEIQESLEGDEDPLVSEEEPGPRLEEAKGEDLEKEEPEVEKEIENEIEIEKEVEKEVEVEQEVKVEKEAEKEVEKEENLGLSLVEKGIGSSQALPAPKESGPIEIERESSLFINYNFQLGFGDLRTLEPSYSLDLPQGLDLSGIQSGQDGHQLGKTGYITVDGLEESRLSFKASLRGGRIIIEFGDDLAQLDAFKSGLEKLIDLDPTNPILQQTVSGDFGFEYKFTEEQKTYETLSIGPLIAGGTAIEIKFVNGPDVESGFKLLDKKASLNKQTKLIEWTVDLGDLSLKEGEAIEFTDTIGQGHTYVDQSFRIQDYPRDPGLIEKEKELSFKLEGPLDKRSLKLSYSTKIDSIGQVNVENSKESLYLNTFTGKFKGETTSLEKQLGLGLIDKNLQAGGDGNTLKWVVTINPDGLDLGELEFMDTIGPGHSLVEDSIELNGQPVINELSGSQDIKLDLGRVDKKIEITYETRPVDLSGQIDSSIDGYRNTAQLIQGDKILSASSGIGHGLLNKEGSLDKKSGKAYFIDWTLDVNPDGKNLSGTSLEDEYGSGQELLEDSLQVYKGDQLIETGYNFTRLDNDLGFRLVFTSPIGRDTYKIKYRTKLVDKDIIGVNSPEGSLVYNRARLGNYEVNAAIKVPSQLIDKANMGYDYKTRRMDWELVVNQNEMPLTAVKIVDKLGPGQSFDQDSIKILDKNNSLLDKNAYSLSFTDLENASQEMTLEFKGEITDKYFISYSSLVDPAYLEEANMNGQQVVNMNNSASLSGDQINASIQVSSSRDIRDSVLTKEGRLDVNQGKLSWEVDFNENHLDLGQVVLSDQLEEGLELDLSSVRLYRMEIDENLRPVKAEQVMNQLETSYDYTSRQIDFTFKDPVSSAYIISFDTDIVAKPKDGRISNTIEFKGTSTIKDSYQSNSIRFTENDWSHINGLGGIKGVIKLSKINEAAEPLAGAKIGLYNSARLLIEEQTTDENGAIRFSELTRGETYFLREIQAPKGYELDSQYYQLDIGETGLENIIRNFQLVNKKTAGEKPDGPNEKPGPDKPGSSGGSSRPDRDKGDKKPVTDLDPSRPKPGTDQARPGEKIEESRSKDLATGSDLAGPKDETKDETESKYLDMMDEQASKDLGDGQDQHVLEDGNQDLHQRLPKTGTVKPLVFYGLGLVFIMAGLGLVRNKKAKKKK